MNPPKAESTNWSSLAVKRTLAMMAWALAWTGTMVLADKAELYGWYTSRAQAMTAIVLNTLIGAGMIWYFIRYLRCLDELQRKIQLDALALAMGVGLVGSFTYSLLVTTGFVIDNEVSDIILLMVITYMLAVVVGQVRYR